MIKPLTSLRFFFALMVFFSHLSFLQHSKYKVLTHFFDFVFSEGHIGVSFFFILSGFILAYNYQDRILKNKKSKRKFYQARIARILPLHILTFILALPFTYNLFFEHQFLWISQAITNLTLTQSYIPFEPIYYSFNAPSWSISDEMFFYFAFPFLIFLAYRFKTYKYFLLLIIITTIPFLTLVIPEKYDYWTFYINPFVRIIDFILGIFVFNIYQVVLRKENTINYNFIEISAILLFVIFFIGHYWIAIVWRYSFYYWIPMSYLIFCFSFQKGFLSKILSNKIFIHLGEISFGFYMFHQLVIRYFYAVNSEFLFLENDILITIILFLISFIVSHYSFILFEKPINNYMKKPNTFWNSLFS